MDIARDILSRKRVIWENLEKGGFSAPSEDSETWEYSEPFMDGDLTALITVSHEGIITAKAVDTLSKEEYLPMNIDSYTGSYVGSAREAFREILTHIADNCFGDVPFSSDQANRIALAIEQKFGAKPEHPFKKDEGAVFRHSTSGRWFALDMNVKRDKLDDPNTDDTSAVSSGMIDVMNVKIDPGKLDDLLHEPGICRCYHMNKKLWVTLTMDDRLSDRRIMELIRESYALTSGSSIPLKSRRPAGGRSYWIIPSNPANYNVAEGFKKSRDHIIPWHHRINVQPGDIVYIYQTEPVAAILFRCEVVDSFLPRPSSWSWLAPTSKYRMDLKLLQTFNKDMYPRSWMNEHGIKKTVRGQRSAPADLVELIEKQNP